MTDADKNQHFWWFFEKVSKVHITESIQSEKLLDNEETHIHTKFHEDLIISYRENTENCQKS